MKRRQGSKRIFSKMITIWLRITRPGDKKLYSKEEKKGSIKKIGKNFAFFTRKSLSLIEHLFARNGIN
ncbi:hypothetical protein LEP1GSC050_2444 [Leptospira broomii serovar Hurstbridge str. 5399]|uniref:Uncharacterized protein n=1 Tax=Leptospira broomii serovar Hurstbridge str. 5399 TaxID=1049789 RepID=T0EZ49_9LEPT|nr:hypothetical protein LEP1GSC050_2444 [Leptospira broomii serovar Hurstbridge str. 5399]